MVDIVNSNAGRIIATILGAPVSGLLGLFASKVLDRWGVLDAPANVLGDFLKSHVTASDLATLTGLVLFAGTYGLLLWFAWRRRRTEPANNSQGIATAPSTEPVNRPRPPTSLPATPSLPDEAPSSGRMLVNLEAGGILSGSEVHVGTALGFDGVVGGSGRVEKSNIGVDRIDSRPGSESNRYEPPAFLQNSGMIDCHIELGGIKGYGSIVGGSGQIYNSKVKIGKFEGGGTRPSSRESRHNGWQILDNGDGTYLHRRWLDLPSRRPEVAIEVMHRDLVALKLRDEFERTLGYNDSPRAGAIRVQTRSAPEKVQIEARSLSREHPEWKIFI